MRVAGVLFLPALAALACVAVLEIATGGPQPVKTGDAQSFVWKKRVFKNKQQFETWLERRNVSYADWAARHPKASPPWDRESRDDGLGALSLLAAALAGFAGFFLLTRDAVRRLARRGFATLRASLRQEELFRPVPAVAAGSLRDAVSVYGLRTPGGVEPPTDADRPELVLVETTPVESRVQPEPRSAVAEAPRRPAVAVDPEPEVAAEAPAPPRPRPKRRPAKRAVEKPPPVRAAPAEEPARLDPEPEPEPTASDPEPDPVVARAPKRRARRATRPARKAAVKFTSSAATAPVEEPVTREPIARPAASLRVPETNREQIAPPAEAETPRQEQVSETVPIDDIDRQAPAPPTFPFREVRCEVAFWRGFFKGQFYARIWGGDESSAIATSPMFRCRTATPEQTEECLAALAALHDLLIAEGWEPRGTGRTWYATRFTNHVPV